MIYRESHCVFLVYDITDRDSFEEIGSWIDEIDEYCDHNTVKILLGNKSDLEEKRAVS